MVTGAAIVGWVWPAARATKSRIARRVSASRRQPQQQQQSAPQLAHEHERARHSSSGEARRYVTETGRGKKKRGEKRKICMKLDTRASGMGATPSPTRGRERERRRGSAATAAPRVATPPGAAADQREDRFSTAANYIVDDHACFGTSIFSLMSLKKSLWRTCSRQQKDEWQ